MLRRYRKRQFSLSFHSIQWKKRLSTKDSLQRSQHFTEHSRLANKNMHNLNPAFLKNYLLPKSTSHDLRRNDVLVVPKIKTTNYGIRSISFLGPKKWNSLPNEIKSSKNADQFKVLIKVWNFEKKRKQACGQ